jgi:hypothetical protein
LAGNGPIATNAASTGSARLWRGARCSTATHPHRSVDTDTIGPGRGTHRKIRS